MKSILREYVLPILLPVVIALPFLYGAAVAEANVRLGRDVGAMVELAGSLEKQPTKCIYVSSYSPSPFEEVFYKLGEVQGFDRYGWKPMIGDSARSWVWPWEYDQITAFCSQ